MDAVAGLLEGPRARGAFLLRSSLSPPWSLRIEDEAPLTVTSIVRGDAWVLPRGGDPVAMQRGDVAIFRGPDPYTVASHPATPPQVAILPGQECVVLDPDGEALVDSLGYGVRTWGNALEGATVMLTGTYQLDGEVSQRLLRALPSLVQLRDHDWSTPIIPLLGLRRANQARRTAISSGSSRPACRAPRSPGVSTSWWESRR